MHLDVYLDTICPWCLIGKRRLEQALELWRGRQVPRIHWRAYQLNPEMPREGMDRKSYLRLKFGSDQGAQRVYQSIAETAEQEGLHFAFDAIQRTPNTLDSHRLIRFAESHGLQDRLLERLFQGYFLEGADIGDSTVLARLAKESGLPGPEAEAYLASDDDRQTIRQEDTNARVNGIVGVPCFVGNGRYALPGAQPPEALVRLFELMQQEGQAAAEPAETGT
ncbi:DsbA family oxidoreductase [Fodinicurvata fenggangensis]|uniref:DsbA family oxidoreductase n=1 Tax=Fodinicurvata fenggangensis TaxID=1121830 RepID=UPI00047DF2DA|nr:DsbA family oxidoreductase [Fodinicurvata fenggangensis]